ncbi:hypothetical protein PtA15_2A28 [Puccinia triticina]|uniref:Adenosinetriphosphatase n=1 Tax=Puccinia triticina TaxID=208348 RepID=A0ABY7CFY3_9BASI|nr:uncharacterized protein PtA15_2A28 [Puccinia triticina]WAQ81717.1 hypothetical protein PtA15_2A28 [Puccinia triticina]
MASPPTEPSSLDSGLPTQTTPIEETGTTQPEGPTAVPFQEIVLEGNEKPESRDKLARLNYLLKASGVYSKIIADNIERERASRAAALKKQADQLKKKESESKQQESQSDPTQPKQGASPDPKTAERRSSRRTKADCPPPKPNPPSRTKSSGAQTRRQRNAAVDENQADTEAEIEKLLENVGPEDQESTTIPTDEKHDPQSGQPALITGATLRSYQLAGMHWLATLYENGLNGILADEMGLGKTLQTIAFLCYLRERGVWGPFLIVCPLSTVANWVNEFERFCPTVPVVLYHGTKVEREELRSTRMAPPRDDPKAWLGKHPSSKAKRGGRAAATTWTKQNTKDTFPVVVTSYEIVMNDCQFLRQYAWSYIVVDESHRLKNLECKLVQELKSYQSANRLLLTGTPLHNNLKELWSLLNFILPEVFDDYSSFEQWFDLSSVTAASDSAAALSTAQAQHIVTSLHDILKPFLLRRVKSEVETNLPKKKEYLLTAPLTAQQKELYDAVISRDLRTYLVKQKTQAGLDWATELKGWKVCRIDGVTRQDSRREQMKEFNEAQGPDACHLFLLSTRAGGVGINLVAADTVILFDSDWNPQQDLQAQDRVHRIGQTKPVLVFRLVSGNTIESKMLEKASQKRKLETLVIGNGFDLTQKAEDEDANSDDDIQNILLGKQSNRKKQKSMKELAEALLKTDGERITLCEQGDQILGDDQLDALLDRSDEAMERKLGWKTEASATVATGVEVYQTKAAE